MGSSDLEDGRFNYSVPRKAANRSPLGEQSFSRGGSQGARGRRNTPRKRPLGSDDEDDANQARGQHESASEQDAIMSLVTLKQQPPREVQAGRGTASQRSGAKERRRGDDGVSEPGLPPRANLKRQALSGFSPGRGSWGEERGRRTGASVEPGAVRTTAPRSAGKREARPEFSRRAVEHNRAPAGDGNLQPGVQSQRSLGLGTGAGPGQASAFTNLQTSSQATPPKEHRPISPALAAHDRDDLGRTSAFQRLSNAPGQGLRGMQNNTAQHREDGGLVTPSRDPRYKAMTPPPASEKFRDSATNVASRDPLTNVASRDTLTNVASRDPLTNVAYRDPLSAHMSPREANSPNQSGGASGAANEQPPGSAKWGESKRPDDSSSGESGLHRAPVAAAEAEVPVRSTGSSATDVRHGESGLAPDLILPEAMSMSQQARWPQPLSPHASLQNLSPHSSQKTLSPVKSMRGVILWDDNGKGRDKVLQDVKAFAALQEPNAVSEEDALQGALKYADSIQMGPTADMAPEELQTLAVAMCAALKQLEPLDEALKAINNELNSRRVVDGTADGITPLQAVLSLREPVLSAAIRDLTALGQVELTVAGCLESSIEQLEWLKKYSEAYAAQESHSARLVQNRHHRNIVCHAIGNLNAGNELMEQFETLKVLVGESYDVLQASNAAESQMLAAYQALLKAGTPTITPDRLKQNKLPMVVEKDVLYQYTLLRLVQNIQAKVRTMLNSVNMNNLPTGGNDQEACNNLQKLWSMFHTLLNRVVSQHKLPDTGVASTAISYFKAMLQHVPKSWRGSMTAAVASCRRHGLRVMMPRGTDIGPVSVDLAALLSINSPGGQQLRPPAVRPPPGIRGMLSAPASVNMLGTAGGLPDMGGAGLPGLARSPIASPPAAPPGPPIVRPTPLKPSPHSLRPILEGQRSGFLGPQGIWSLGISQSEPFLAGARSTPLDTPFLQVASLGPGLGQPAPAAHIDLLTQLGMGNRQTSSPLAIERTSSMVVRGSLPTSIPTVTWPTPQGPPVGTSAGGLSTPSRLPGWPSGKEGPNPLL